MKAAERPEFPWTPSASPAARPESGEDAIVSPKNFMGLIFRLFKDSAVAACIRLVFLTVYYYGSV
jgi:hypothetical protein